MTPLDQIRSIAATLEVAAADHAAGRMGERELLAICLASDEMIRSINLAPHANTAYASVSKMAQAKITERVAELDRGDA